MTGPSDDERAAAREPHGRKRSSDDARGRVDGETSPSARANKAVPDRAGGLKNSGKDRAGSRLPAYGALDLGTNNCRLLVARPSRRGFYVIDAFSRIIRLGEGVSGSGQLSPEAMERTIAALKVCSEKMKRRRVERSRVIATEACRVAANSNEFIDQVRERTGLELEIVSQETEARLAVSGCASLLDSDCDYALVFDIGGGSSELIWLDLTKRTRSWRRSIYDRLDAQNCIVAWTSLPLGVVTLAEKHGGRHVDHTIFEAMVADVSTMLSEFERSHCLQECVRAGRAHLLGTSGTVTTIAGIHLALPAYDRKRVDGCWLNVPEAKDVSNSLIAMSYEERVAQPCIGRERADLVLAGCAILEAVLRMWPCERLRVADRGLREGILATLMAEDGYPRARRRRPSGRS